MGAWIDARNDDDRPAAQGKNRDRPRFSISLEIGCLSLIPTSCMVVPIFRAPPVSYGPTVPSIEAVVGKYEIAICGRKPWSVPISPPGLAERTK